MRAVTIERSLINGCGLSHESAENGWQFGDVLGIKPQGNEEYGTCEGPISSK